MLGAGDPRAQAASPVRVWHVDATRWPGGELILWRKVEPVTPRIYGGASGQAMRIEELARILARGGLSCLTR